MSNDSALEAFRSFDIAELDVLELDDSMALPEMGASSGVAAASIEGTFCCSSSSSSSSCCCC